MSNKTNEEIKNLEKQLELLKQKQKIEDENKQLRDDVAYLRKIKELQDKGEAIGCMGIMGCTGVLLICGLIAFSLLILGGIFGL